MVKRKASSAGLGEASPSSKRQQAQTPAERAGQKLRETFSHLTMEEVEILASPLSGLTLRQQLVKDCEVEDAGGYIRWGKGYTCQRTHEFRSPTSTFAKLQCGAEAPAANEELKKVMVLQKMLVSVMYSCPPK